MILYLEVTEIGEDFEPRSLLRVVQANLPPTDDVGVELVIPTGIKQSEWDVFYAGLPHSSQLIDACALPALARVRVADEMDAKAAWLILRPWFDGVPVTIQLHEHNADVMCVTRDFDPNA